MCAASCEQPLTLLQLTQVRRALCNSIEIYPPEPRDSCASASNIDPSGKQFQRVGCRLVPLIPSRSTTSTKAAQLCASSFGGNIYRICP
jgi:hypothetical protein